MGDDDEGVMKDDERALDWGHIGHFISHILPSKAENRIPKRENPPPFVRPTPTRQAVSFSVGQNRARPRPSPYNIPGDTVVTCKFASSGASTQQHSYYRVLSARG